MKILIADDHPLFRDAMQGVVKRAVADSQVVICNDFSCAEQAIAEQQDFDLALLDLHMPDGDGYFGLIRLRNHFPTLPVVIVSGTDDIAVIKRCMGFGASGFIPKTLPPDEMITAIGQILEGDIFLPKAIAHEIDKVDENDRLFAEKVAALTQQQYRVLCELTEGRLNKQIAYDLNISEATVKAHVTAIFKKLGVINRTQAVIAAQRLQFTNHLDDSQLNEA
ncbi:MAG: response regulator transcription factor [Gammaproteobacteria bacterium]|nr:response regulator transcription factor [Gammaproteobacteria bacterium]NVK87256.1 response regulator transcription factor [Gammaproteobacteria bacterium]